MPNKKPDIPVKILQRWQRLVDLMGQLTQTPAALITRALPRAMQMLIRSDNPENPYVEQELSPRKCGLYCDRVIESRASLLVKDASLEREWQSNPDMTLGLSFYLGYPLYWPDGEVFGTLCVLDVKDNQRAREYRDLMVEFQQLVNEDLSFLLLSEYSGEKQKELEKNLRQQEVEISDRANDLAEINTAMRVLLRHQKHDKAMIEQARLLELRQMVEPWLQKLEHSGLSLQQCSYLQCIREQLARDTLQSSTRMSALTAMERQVAKAISEGMSSKIIAQKFYLEKSTIDFHRRNIRQKLGLVSKSIGLKQYLLNIQQS